MGHSNGIISAPVSIDDVKAVLGTTSNDLGTLCKDDAGLINMWAKYKPFRNDAVAFRQDGDEFNYTDRDEAIKAANCGLVVPTVRLATGLSSLWSDRWTYLHPCEIITPSGRHQYPYRLADFIHYSHRDAAPCIATGSINIDAFWDRPTYVQLSKLSGIQTQYGITLKDFGQFTTYNHLGVVVTDANSTYTYIYVFDYDISTNPQTVQIAYNRISNMHNTFSRAQLKYVLCATNHPSTDGLFTTDIRSGYGWLALPNDGASTKVNGTIDITYDFHMTTVVNGAKGTESGAWTDWSRYYGLLPSSPTDADYYLPSASYHFSMFVRFSFKNTGQAVVFRKSAVKCYCEGNLSISGNTPQLAPLAMYNSAGTSVDEISIAAGATVHIGFQLPDYIFTMNASGVHQAFQSSGRRLTRYVRFLYTGSSTPQFSALIHLRDN